MTGETIKRKNSAAFVPSGSQKGGSGLAEKMTSESGWMLGLSVKFIRNCVKREGKVILHLRLGSVGENLSLFSPAT